MGSDFVELEHLEKSLEEAAPRLAEIWAWQERTFAASMAASKTYKISGNPEKLDEYRELERENMKALTASLALRGEMQAIRQRIDAIHWADEQGESWLLVRANASRHGKHTVPNLLLMSLHA